jgi:hypothetical protein
MGIRVIDPQYSLLAVRSERGGSEEEAAKKQAPVSQQMWHNKEPSLHFKFHKRREYP